MKTNTKIRSERPYYFVSVNGNNLFESESIEECKEYLCKYISEHRKEIIEENELYNYFIGMYSIGIM